ncbi:MAG: hypothetical protein JXQ26_09240, partial [Tissierellales bacterium]|nr:hypothetical protein [Tissierellales bacterium]
TADSRFAVPCPSDRNALRNPPRQHVPTVISHFEKTRKTELMKKIITILLLTTSIFTQGQSLNKVSEIINLAKIYRGNHGLSGLDDNSASIFSKYQGTEFERVAKFIEESTKNKNRVIEKEFLTRPDSTTLKIFHTIIMVNYNMYESKPEDNEKVVTKYLETDISNYEQIQQYYGSLFISVINKNRPFDYSNQNWNLDSLGFKDDKEKAVFFLVFMDKLGSQISSYLGAMKGPNWDGIEKYVGLLPKINGKNYYEYDAFYFKDFKMTIYKKYQFFKKYYLPKFYDILVGHILMMEQKKFDRKDITQFLLTSILSEKQYYEYCNRMDVINSYLKEKK